MNINLKEYQRNKVNELINKCKNLLEMDEKGKICIFQAPTGSGKTIMTARFIDEFIKEIPEINMCFIWISVGKGNLHIQSKNSLDKVFDGAPRVSLLENEFTGSRERIVDNEVVVVNWEKIRTKDNKTGEWKNILMKDGEKLNSKELLSLDVDILIPAAIPDLITEENKDLIKAKIISCGSNLPITEEIEEEFHKKDILVIPDFVANAGGVISSYVETIEGTSEKMFEIVEEKITSNTKEMLKRSDEKKIKPRDAAMEIAKERVEAASKNV